MTYVALGIALVLLAGLIWRWMSVGQWWEPRDWQDEIQLAIRWVFWPLTVLAWIVFLVAVMVLLRLRTRER